MSGIPGESVDRKLLHLFCFDKEYADLAGDLLLKRTGPLAFSVPDEQIEILLEGVRQNKPYVQAILEQCVQPPKVLQCRPYLDRFITEVKYTGEENDMRICTNYSSPRVMRIHYVLQAIKGLGEIIQPYLREALEQARRENDAEVEKWLCIALGTVGSTDVANYLANVVRNDPDPYTRHAAIHPYALSAGREAIPLLRELLKDKTVSEYVPEDSPGRDFIYGEAWGELVQLTKEEFENTPYIRRISEMLAGHKLTKEMLREMPDETASALHDGTIETKGLLKTRELLSAFYNQDLEYIQKFINERRANNAEDPLVLLLNFEINISHRKLDDCLENIKEMMSLLDRKDQPCQKYIITCIHSMIVSFEGVYRRYFLEPEKYGIEEPLVLRSFYDVYLFELGGGL